MQTASRMTVPITIVAIAATLLSASSATFVFPPTFPSPTGNVPYNLQLPGAMGAFAFAKEDWWYYAGVVTDEKTKQNHSVQFQILKTGLGLAAGILGFSYNEDQFLWTAYCDSLWDTVGWFSQKKSPKIDAFEVNLSGSHNLHYNFSYIGASPSLPIGYKGYVGQPGALYNLTGTGFGMTDYSGETGHGNRVPYRANFVVFDERGLVAEGWSGAVGGTLEYAQPRLRVLSFRVDSGDDHFECNANFVVSNLSQGNYDPKCGRLWLDKQVVYTTAPQTEEDSPFEGTTTSTPTTAHDAAKPNTKAPSSLRSSPFSLTHALKGVEGAKGCDWKMDQLYRGTWMSTQLTSYPYNGVAATFVAFWKEPSDSQLMWKSDTDVDALNGFMNLYIPETCEDSFGDGDRPAQPSILSACPHQPYSLMAQIPLNDTRSKKNDVVAHPYRIRGVRAGPKSAISGNTYASQVEVTIRALTPARMALASLAVARGYESAADVAKDFKLVFTSVSNMTENVMFAPGNQFYEGGATIALNGEEVGMGFIEQMGYN